MRAALIVEGIDFSQYFVIVANKYMNQQTIWDQPAMQYTDKILVRKLKGEMSQRLICRWQYNIKTNLRERCYADMGWTEAAHAGVQWEASEVDSIHSCIITDCS
jgi:hypothetical protein